MYKKVKFGAAEVLFLSSFLFFSSSAQWLVIAGGMIRYGGGRGTAAGTAGTPRCPLIGVITAGNREKSNQRRPPLLALVPGMGVLLCIVGPAGRGITSEG